MRKFLFIFSIISLYLFVGCPDKGNNPSDNKYESVTICNQVWMKKNLDVDHYRNGDSIPEVRDSAQWANLTTGAWCYYNNSDSLGKIYGKLYNWYAVNDPRGLAPEGWHVSSDAEWKELEMCLGMSQEEADKIFTRGTDEGGKLKENGTSHWGSPNYGATNLSGFSALPGGYHDYLGAYFDIGYSGHLWSSTEFDATLAWFRSLGFNNSNIIKIFFDKRFGFSVRCIKNN